MSGGNKCTCGRKHGDIADLAVTVRKCNYSAFNGYRRTPSDYSEIVCLRPGCLGVRRTKAKYVDQLPDVSLSQIRYE